METNNKDNWRETTFLANVAKDLMVRFGKDMTNVTVVYPNKRARLFMNEEFLALTDTPMWAPEYATIAELFGRITGDNVMEPIPAVCTLYNIYKVLMGDKSETLDMFWGWGEIIISDFDDIDKHLVNADALFFNVQTGLHGDHHAGFQFCQCLAENIMGIQTKAVAYTMIIIVTHALAVFARPEPDGHRLL